ncbi:MAG: polymer-forming cytoskeletal protein [Sulfuritalea sp.]|nr:polymer-forming cytoskeletal protein [Sulfuritalea sp.]MDP1981060.1 polymer-forming cytoskeletal protein [Sulfuritalea sp.]
MRADTDKTNTRLAAGETLIGAGTVLAGDIVFSGGLRIDGEVKGNVRSRDGMPGTLVIGAQGRIEGDVDVARLVVNGLIAGRVDSSELLQLRSTARIDSDVSYALAEIDPGAIIRGQLAQRQGAATAVAADPPFAKAALRKS